MLHELWAHVRPPSCFETRRTIAIMLIGYGLLVSTNTLGSALGPTPYDNPGDMVTLPQSAYGLGALAVGMMIMITARARLRRRGHVAAVVATALCAFIAGGYYDRFVPMFLFIIMAYAMFGESAAKYER